MAYDQDLQDPNSSTNPTQDTPNLGQPVGSPQVRSAVANMFQTALGRPATEDEITAQIVGGSGDLASIQQAIYASPEAAAYNLARQAPASGPAPTSTPGAPTTSPTTPSGPQSIEGKYTYGQALDYANGLAQQQWGRGLNPEDITAMKTALGYQDGAPIDGSVRSLINNWIGSNVPKKVTTTPPTGTTTTTPTTPTGTTTTGTTTTGGGSNSDPGSGGNSYVNTNPDITANIRQFAANLNPGISGGIVQNPGASSQALVDALLKRSQQSLSIDPNTDPIIHPQVDAASAIQQRGRRNYLNDLAESSNPYATGARQTAANQTQEANDQNIAGLQSQLVQNELGARRNDISNAMGSMGSLLTNDQQLSLQRQMDAISSALGQQQMNNNLGLGLLTANNQSQGLANQNQQYYAGLSAQDRQFLNSLAYQYAGLNSNNSQFAANYGLNATNQANYWDAIRRGLL